MTTYAGQLEVEDLIRWLDVYLPEWAEPFLSPAPYKSAKGGRGSGKTHTVARIVILRTMAACIRVLCLREFQKNISESVKQVLDDLIRAWGLESPDQFTIHDHMIRHANGSEIMFMGIAPEHRGRDGL